MSTFFFILFMAGLLVKLTQAIKNVSQSFLYTVMSLLGLLLLFKWVIKPMYKFVVWFGHKLWKGLKWMGMKMEKHYTYRNDYLYWFNVANSKDRLAFIEEVTITQHVTSY